MKPLFIGLLLLLINYSFATSTLNKNSVISILKNELDSFPICSKFNEKVKIDTNLFRNRNSELVDFVVDKNKYQFICFVDLNKDNKRDIVLHEPNSIGTSNEQLYTFFINCGNGYYVPILKEYARRFHIKKDLTNSFDCHHIILESWDIRIDSTETYIDKHFYTYSFDGEQNFIRMRPDLIFESKDIFIEEIPGDCISSIYSTQNSTNVGFDFVKINPELNSIDIELKNQKTLILNSVKSSEITEGTSHYKLIQYYKKIDYILFHKESWEMQEYLLISLNNGLIIRLKNYPIFTKSQEKFCTIENKDGMYTIDKKLAIYTIKNKKIAAPFIIDIKGNIHSPSKNRLRKFSIKIVDWIGESGFHCIQTIDNGLQDIEREATIWLKKNI